MLKHSSWSYSWHCLIDTPERLEHFLILTLNYWVGWWISWHRFMHWRALGCDLLIRKLITACVQHFPLNRDSFQVLAAFVLSFHTPDTPPRYYAGFLFFFLLISPCELPWGWDIAWRYRFPWASSWWLHIGLTNLKVYISPISVFLTFSIPYLKKSEYRLYS